MSKMVDGSEKRKRQLAFELQNSRVSFVFPLFLEHLQVNKELSHQHRQKNMTASLPFCSRQTCQNHARATRQQLTNWSATFMW